MGERGKQKIGQFCCIYCRKQMQHKAILHNFPLLNGQDWTIVHNHEVLSVVNNYTVDEFVFEKVNSNSWHLFDIYKARAQYLIPNTPQIILASYQPEPYAIEMFVQLAHFNLDRLARKNMCETSILQLIKNVLQTVQFLVKKFGFFKITPAMVRITRSNNFLVWVHENFNSTHRQYPLSSTNIYQDYKIMVNDLLAVFQAAGFKKQLESVKEKIAADKLVSFEKFKAVLQHHLRCNDKSKERSEKSYRSPQFLKKRNSPTNARRGVTQNFVIEHNKAKQARFATSMNLGLQNCKSSSQMMKQKSQGQISDPFAQQLLFKRALSNDASIKSIDLHPADVYFESEIHNDVVKKDLDGSDMKKKNFRDSGNSLSTTAFMNSMTSSGKYKMNTFQQHNFSVSILKQGENKGLASSVGTKEARKIRDLKDTFKVKASKIIQQNNEELVTNTVQSFIKTDKQVQKSQEQEDVERDLGGLLKSECSSNYRPSSDMLELESQIFNILSG